MNYNYLQRLMIEMVNILKLSTCTELFCQAPTISKFEDLESFIKRRKEKKVREHELRKQQKIDQYFKIIKKEKPAVKEVTTYDGDDKSDTT